MYCVILYLKENWHAKDGVWVGSGGIGICFYLLSENFVPRTT